MKDREALERITPLVGRGLEPDGMAPAEALGEIAAVLDQVEPPLAGECEITDPPAHVRQLGPRRPPPAS
jgi:hypothetical protein